MTFKDKLENKIHAEASEYLAEYDIIEGANLLAPLLVECYDLLVEINKAKSSGADVYGFADAVKFDSKEMIKKLESFVKDGRNETTT